MTKEAYNEIVSEITFRVEKDPVQRMLIFTLGIQSMSPEQLKAAARIAIGLLEPFSDNWSVEWRRSIMKDPNNLKMFLNIKTL